MRQEIEKMLHFLERGGINKTSQVNTCVLQRPSSHGSEIQEQHMPEVAAKAVVDEAEDDEDDNDEDNILEISTIDLSVQIAGSLAECSLLRG